MEASHSVDWGPCVATIGVVDGPSAVACPLPDAILSGDSVGKFPLLSSSGGLGTTYETYVY